MANFSQDAGQYPLNVIGPKGQKAFLGMETVFFEGTTGLVGTAYGIPGVTATRIATGSYDLIYPPTREVRIIPGLQAPTGMHYTVNISDVFPFSGKAKIQIARMGGGSVPSGSTTPTMMSQPHNPVSGTMLNLQFFVSPITPY